MSKGTFGTPRPTGTVDEIQIGNINMQRESDGNYFLMVGVIEGTEVGGVFEPKESNSINLKISDLGASDQAAFDNFLKVLISQYINDRGYSGVTIT